MVAWVRGSVCQGAGGVWGVQGVCGQARPAACRSGVPS